jgi:hypothetical protein
LNRDRWHRPLQRPLSAAVQHDDRNSLQGEISQFHAPAH